MLNIFLIFLSCSGLASARLPPLAVHVTAAKPAPLRESKKAPAIFREVFPILAASFVTAAAMYPADLLRALQMNQATSGSAIKLTSPKRCLSFVSSSTF